MPTLAPEEWAELIASLKWADELFELGLEKHPSDVVFRRGGRLQNYNLLWGTTWKEIDVHHLLPKLPIFVSASYSAIQQTFKDNEEVKRIIKLSPDLFCDSPQRALEVQDEWFGRLKDYPGLVVTPYISKAFKSLGMTSSANSSEADCS